MMKKDKASARLINIVICQLQFLLSLVNDLLDIKMIEKGVFEPRCDNFNIRDTIDFVLQMFSEQSKLTQTEVSHESLMPSSLKEAYALHYDEIMLEKAELPEQLFGDAIRLKQVLINLIKNALKFTRQGTVKVFSAYDKVKQELQIHVVDNGRGITESEMASLFSMFGKLKRTAKQNSEGIGMGLMICKNLIEANRGALTVKSKGENCGSSFMFTM